MSRDITMNWFVYSSEYAAYMTGVLGSSVTRLENNLLNDLYRGSSTVSPIRQASPPS